MPTESLKVEGPRIGPDDVEAVAHAVDPQGLAHVLVVGDLQTQSVLGRIGHAQDPPGAVDHESPELLACVVVLALQETTDESDRRREVVEEVPNSDPDRRGGAIVLVGLGHGLEDPEIEPVVDPEHHAVPALQRVRHRDRLLGELLPRIHRIRPCSGPRRGRTSAVGDRIDGSWRVMVDGFRAWPLHPATVTIPATIRSISFHRLPSSGVGALAGVSLPKALSRISNCGSRVSDANRATVMASTVNRPK